jgi:ribosomal protein L7/L12
MPQDPFVWFLLGLALWLGFVIGRATGAGRAGRDRLAGPPQLPPNVSPEAMARIRAELAAGNTITAIKLMRDATPGMGLKEAKDAVEALERG